MDSQDASFTRRTFLTSVASFGSVAALGWATLPNLPRLVRHASVVLPNWATTTPVSAGAYRTAVLLPDLLVALPCFCGCVSYAPAHRSLYDCFVRPDGAFETHAAGCFTCQEEALAAGRWADQGLTVADVRRNVVARFEDRGPSTDGAAG
jgi:hypothetical protein